MHPIDFDHEFLQLECSVHRQHRILCLVPGIRYKNIFGLRNIVFKNDFVKCRTCLGDVGVFIIDKFHIIVIGTMYAL